MRLFDKYLKSCYLFAAIKGWKNEDGSARGRQQTLLVIEYLGLYETAFIKYDLATSFLGSKSFNVEEHF